MNNIIEWATLKGNQGSIVNISLPAADIANNSTSEFIEWVIPEVSISTEQTVQRRLDDLEKGYHIWYELGEPDSRLVSTWLTSALLHAVEHTFATCLGEWPAQYYDNSEICIEFGRWRVQLWFTCQPHLGEDQFYMPQFDGVISNKHANETMAFVLREYDDIIDGIIFCNNYGLADKFIADICGKYFTELFKASEEHEYPYYGAVHA